MNSSLGSVRRGNLADLIAIDLDQPHLTPTGSIVNTLIESASGADVKHSIINGKLVMKDRKLLTIDEEKVVSEANQAMKNHALFTKAGAYTG